MEKGISEIVGVFADPIIVFPWGWGEDLPERLKDAITLERLEMNMKALKGEGMTGTDAELFRFRAMNSGEIEITMVYNRPREEKILDYQVFTVDIERGLKWMRGLNLT